MHQRGDSHHLYRAVLPGLCLPLANYLISFPQGPVLDPCLTCMRIFLPWIPVQKPMGRLTPPIMWWRPPPPLDPQEPFCACLVKEVSLTSRMRNMWFLYLLSKRGSAPPCSCHYLFLEYLSTGDRCQLLSLKPIYLLPHLDLRLPSFWKYEK